ncbi:hypothetical protein D3C81_1669750 [compost metagenome]
MHEISRNSRFVQYNWIAAAHFDIAKAFIAKFRHKFILFPTTQRQDVGLKGFQFFIPTIIYINIGQIQASICLQSFAMLDFDHRPCLTTNLYLCHTGHILSHIKDVGFLIHLFH